MGKRVVLFGVYHNIATTYRPGQTLPEPVDLFIVNYTLYWFYLFSAMIIAGIAKEHRCFDGFYKWLFQAVRSKKAIVVLYSVIGGILPIPGRIITTATLLNTIPVTDKKTRSSLGIVGYLSTHHYYFWSPLEATVVIPLTVLHLTYSGLLYLLWPIILVYLLVTAWSVYRLDGSKLDVPGIITNYRPIHAIPLILGIVTIVAGVPPYIGLTGAAVYYLYLTKTFSIKKISKYIQWKLVGWLIVVSITAMIVKQRLPEVYHTSSSVYLAAFIGAVAAFLTGSSAKFAGIASGLTVVYGIEYFLLFFGTEFVAYLLSPSHRCVWITKDMFGMSWKEFYIPLGVLAAALVTISVLM